MAKLAQAHNGVLLGFLRLLPMQPPDDPKIIRLPRNGPKPGQSMRDWLYGKERSEQRELERLRWEAIRTKKKAP